MIAGLGDEADSLFRPRGSNPEINAALKIYKDLKQEVSRVSLSSFKWEDLRRSLEEAETKKEELEQDWEKKSLELGRLQRLKNIIPHFAELDNLKRQLQELGEVVPLPEGFQEQVKSVEDRIGEEDILLGRDEEQRAGLEKEAEAIVVNQAVLDQGMVIEGLYQRLGDYRKGLQDRGKLEGMRIALRREVAEIFEYLPVKGDLNQIDSFVPILYERSFFQDMSAKKEALDKQKNSLKQREKRIVKKLTTIADILEKPADIPGDTELVRGIRMARSAGDLDLRIEELERDIGVAQQHAGDTLGRVGLWQGNLKDIAGLPLPSNETIDRFGGEFDRLTSDMLMVFKEKKELGSELADARMERMAMEESGGVLSERDLDEARQQRDSDWRLLRRSWMDGEDISKELAVGEINSSLPDVYEQRVDKADGIADRLRREADRVARNASLLAKIDSLQTRLADNEINMEKFAGVKEKLQSGWQNEWKSAAIMPLPHREMAVWLAEFNGLRLRLETLFLKKREHEDLCRKRLGLQEMLLGLLGELGQKINPVSNKLQLQPAIIVAEEYSRQLAEKRRQQEKLNDQKKQHEGELAEFRQEQKSIREEMDEWQEKWDKALDRYGFDPDLQPKFTLEIIEKIVGCLGKNKEALDFQKRIDGIDRDREIFAKDVDAVVKVINGENAEKSHRIDSGDGEHEQVVLRLQATLKNARQAEERLARLVEEEKRINLKLRTDRQQRGILGEQLQELLQRCGCKKTGEVGELVSRSVERQRLKGKISDCNDTLSRLSDGVDMDDLYRQAKNVDYDTLDLRIGELKNHYELIISPELAVVNQEIGEKKNQMRSMDGSAKAAELTDKMAQSAAGINRMVRQYGQVKLATYLLDREVERYREEHQDPVLAIAGEIFAEITIGSFLNLRTDINDKGEPVLVGVRADKTRLEVSGMSSGTRDQLFLSLRLATLHHRLLTAEPMPFIVDDILINFDKERTMATLKVMADLSEKNQIILFTHHQEVVELAGNITGSEVEVVQVTGDRLN